MEHVDIATRGNAEEYLLNCYENIWAKMKATPQGTCGSSFRPVPPTGSVLGKKKLVKTERVPIGGTIPGQVQILLLREVKQCLNPCSCSDIQTAEQLLAYQVKFFSIKSVG
jgi:hypothetical protein